MSFASPLLLAALALLLGIWWLLRARPPAPRRQVFPAIALLGLLSHDRNDAASPPFWLLLLRLAAASLLIVGFSGPVLRGEPMPLAGSGTLLLVVDDGVMSAANWGERNAAARTVLDAAGRRNRPVILLRTASREADAAPEAASRNSAPADAEVFRPVAADRAAAILDATHPAPWFADRAAAARKLMALRQEGTSIGGVVYISDGVATPANAAVPSSAEGTGDAAFSDALRAIAPVQEIRVEGDSALVLLPAHEASPPAGPLGTSPLAAPVDSGGVVAEAVVLSDTAPRHIRVRAHAQDGGTIALSDVTIPANARNASVSLALPAAMRNRVDALTVDGIASAAATLLLDEGDRLRPVGLISVGASDTPLVGPLFYLRRALGPTADLREGSVASLLTQPLSVMIAPDGTLADADTRARVAKWVQDGGMLIRFAGRTLTGGADSAEPDSTDAGPDHSASPADAHAIAGDLLPVPLMPTARQLGGTMSWGKPQPLAAFATASPFHGLSVPDDVSISRQVLARPAADLGDHTWARLADGTPLVTHTSLGKGEIVLFHVTGTADWSNLPLSGLFVSMLERLGERANGVETPADTVVLPPVLTLDGDGALGPPPPFARGLPASTIATTLPSSEHPPGLYGSRSARRALNIGDTVHSLSSLSPVGTVIDPTGHRPDRVFGPALLALGLLLLAVDAAWTLLLRGGILSRVRGSPRRRRATTGMRSVLLIGGSLAGVYGLPTAQAQSPASDTAPAASAPESVQETAPADSGATSPAPQPVTEVPGAALETRLAYVLTGNSEVDTVSKEGLQGLSNYVNARTSAVLGHPDGVHPGRDDLSYYPLLYWPITPDAQPDAVMTTALTTFMAHGGMIIIDTQGIDPATQSSTDGEQSFAGEAPGVAAALRRVTVGLPIPSLTRLTDQHVLSHTFYLLHAFPGRYAGQPVWIAREGEAENDDVSPVIIGSADWAHAWAIDTEDENPFAVIPGGDDQRRMAYRFGVNAVIYALTGNYKADQVHVPAILKRLGH